MTAVVLGEPTCKASEAELARAGELAEIGVQKRAAHDAKFSERWGFAQAAK